MIEIERADMALFQDRGRLGFQNIGVPVSGAWDLDQYQRVESLLGQNNPVVIEVLAGTLSFMTTEAIDLALTGFGNSDSGRIDHINHLVAGQRFTFTATSTSYIGITGLALPKVLGSCATDTVSGLGPERIGPGDRFEVSPSRHLKRFIREPLSRRSEFRFIPGPHTPLGASSFTVKSIARSGIRLEGEVPSSHLNLASLPLVPGAIQNTGSELIIVGPDGGVTGGYPVVGVIVQADQSALARVKQGSELWLTPVSVGQVPHSPRPAVLDLSAL